MQHQEFETPPALQDAIKCFWYSSENFGAKSSGFEVMPDGNAEIIFYFGSSCSILQNEVMQPLSSPFIMGLQQQPVHFYTTRHLAVIGIRCFPWAIYDLLGLPPDKKAAVRTLEHPVAGLQPVLNELMNAGKLQEAVAAITQFFLQAHAQVAVDSLLYKAGVAMAAANGSLPVSQVAVAAHATVRTLERKFKQSSGHTVKDVSALMRFEQVRNHLWLFPNCNIAALAQQLGYTDQSHLSKEFKRYSGASPAAFARKAKQQAVSNNVVVLVQA